MFGKLNNANLIKSASFFCMLLFHVGLKADVIILNNKDHLTVHIKSIKDQYLLADSSIIGELKVPMSSIYGLELTGSYWIKMKGEKKFKFVAFSDKNTEFYRLLNPKQSENASQSLCEIIELKTKKPVDTQAEDNTTLFKNRSLKNINNDVQEQLQNLSQKSKQASAVITQDQLNKVPKDHWLFSSSVSVYFALNDFGKTNSKNNIFSGSGTHQARNTQYRNILNWEFNNKIDSSNNRTEKYIVGYNFNYFYNKKLFYAVSSQYNHDDGTSPYKLSVFNVGVGYQIFDSDQISLSIEAGPGYSYVQYRTKANESSPSFYGKIDYNQAITKFLSIYDTTNFNVLTGASQFNISGSGGLKYKIRKNVWLSLSHDYTWTNKPEDKEHRYNGNVKFGIGVDW